MVSILLAALKKIITKLALTVASEKLLEWLLFYAAALIVESTKTTKDDKLLEQIKKAYYEGDSDASSTK